MSTRISFDEAQSVKDILNQDNFRLEFGAIPEVGNDDKLSIKVNNAVIPGISNETTPANIGGYALKFRGRVLNPGVLPITFFEDSGSHTIEVLRTWHEFIVQQRENTSKGNKTEYSVTAKLYVFDHKGELTQTWEFKNLFIQDISDTPLSVDSSAPVMVSATFSYDDAKKL